MNSIIRLLNQTERPYPKDKSIATLFEEKVIETPDAVALIHHNISLTYNELNKKSNQLAHYLIDNGVKPETLVAIYCDRSIETIVAILAIIKSGGAYVPLDPTYPIERIKYMLADINASIVLTRSQYLKDLNDLSANKCKIIILDNLDKNVSSYSENNPSASIAQSLNLAYVLYTSGSTGTPKGVMIEQKSIMRLVFNQEYIHFSFENTFLHLSNLSFDAATLEIWGALLHGAKLVIIDQDTLFDFLEFKEYLKNHNKTCFFLTEMLFERMIVQHPDIFKGCYYVLFGGEACNLHNLKLYLEQPNQENFPEYLVNGYGPTECTTFSACYTVPKNQQLHLLPIGKPISNTTLYILTNKNHLAAIGEIGELYIGGDGVARGYLNQPQLTSERFIASPFIKGERLYKTGDLAQYLPDGNIEYKGRTDRQVKLRGYRIELGEIETCLQNISEIENAVVEIESGKNNQNKLVAYLTLNKKYLRYPFYGKGKVTLVNGQTQKVTITDISAGGCCIKGLENLAKPGDLLTILIYKPQETPAIKGEVKWQLHNLTGIQFKVIPKSLVQYIDNQGISAFYTTEDKRNFKSYLEKKLPSYMVPTQYKILTQFPLTPNGKVDRSKFHLLKPLNVKRKLEIAQSKHEAIMMQLWREVLALPTISRTDNFFQLGGNSLLVTQILSKLNKSYQCNITYKEFFNNPILLEQAKLIEHNLEYSLTNTITTTPREKLTPLSFSQHRLWFIEGLVAHCPLNQVLVKVPLKGPLHFIAFEKALSVLMQRHEILRTAIIVDKNGIPHQKIDDSPTIPLSCKDISGTLNKEEKIERIIESQILQRFRLSTAPLFRVLLIKTNIDEHIILTIFNHIIIDGWSLAIFSRDLSIIYNTLLKNPDMPEKQLRYALPTLPIQYADFSSWQHKQLVINNEHFKKLAIFWQHYLHGAPLQTELTIDKPRPHTQLFQANIKKFIIPQEVVDKLQKFCINNNSSLFMPLFCAFNILIHAITGKRDLVIGLPIANRNNVEIENLIGFFVNSIPVRVSFSPLQSFSYLFNEVREALLHCYEHQDLPFEKIVELMNIKPSLQHHPIFQIMFAFQNSPPQQFYLKNLDPDVLEEIPIPFIPFDLLINVEEKNNSVVGSIQYDTELYNQKTINHWIKTWIELAIHIVDYPEKSIDFHAKFASDILLKHNLTHEKPIALNIIPPRTKSEKMLHKIWQEVLVHDKFSITDSFFDVGGHSLLINQVISRIRNNLGFELSYKVLFEVKSIEGLAILIDNLQSPKTKDLSVIKRPEEIPLSFSQKRLWYIEQLFPNQVAYHVPVVLKLLGLLSTKALKAALNAIIEKYEILRTRFLVNEKQQPYQDILSTIKLPLTSIKKSLKNIDDVISSLILRPFDFQEAPLFHIYLLKNSDTNCHLVFVFHHAIIDLSITHKFLNEWRLDHKT